MLATPARPAVLPVACLGAAVLPLVGLAGRVHSVFRRALNLELGPELIAVVAGRAGRLPNGLHLVGAADFRELGVAPGAPVTWSGRRLVVDGVLALDLSGAAVWSDERVPAQLAAPERLEATFRRARASLAPAPLLSEACRTLAEALRAGDVVALRPTVGALVGLGPGLTPAGDDALLGCLAVLQAAGHPIAVQLAEAVLAAAHGTTALSRALLRHAAAGRGAELTIDFARALLGAEPGAIGAALARLLGHGATSGRDTADGALWGLQVLVGGDP